MPYKWKDQKQQYHKAYHADWYQKNKEKVKAKKAERIRKLREWFVEYKSSLKCEQCGASHPAILDFHHRNGEEKDTVVSEIIGRYASKKKLLDEISKCRCLCSNCHRILHYETRGRHEKWKD